MNIERVKLYQQKKNSNTDSCRKKNNISKVPFSRWRFTLNRVSESMCFSIDACVV